VLEAFKAVEWGVGLKADGLNGGVVLLEAAGDATKWVT